MLYYYYRNSSYIDNRIKLSRAVSKPRDWPLELSNRFEVRLKDCSEWKLLQGSTVLLSNCRLRYQHHLCEGMMIDLYVNTFHGKLNVFHISTENMCTLLVLVSEIQRIDRWELLVRIAVIYWRILQLHILIDMEKKRPSSWHTNVITPWHWNGFRIIGP